MEFNKRREELEIGKDGIDEELEELTKKIKDRIIMKRKVVKGNGKIGNVGKRKR